MLGITSVGTLARLLNTTPRQLFDTADRVDELVQIYELTNPAAPQKKSRIVRCPTGQLRNLQANLLRNVLRPALWPSRHSYGGVPGRNAVQNANRHAESRFVYTTDIADFFPSISFYKVRELFQSHLDCCENVASLLARLCTHEGHLAQGLITSPILADRSLRRVDARIAGIARKHNLVYTRFVDDITLSGPFGLSHTESGIVSLVRRIISDSDFRAALHKEQSGSISDGDIAITGLRVINGHLDPVADYILQLDAALDGHRILGLGGEFNRMLFTKSQLQGRVHYVTSINPNRRRSLRARLAVIDWEGVQRNAIARGLITCRKVLSKISGDITERMPSSAKDQKCIIDYNAFDERR